jgi:hypothetical protein
MYHKELAAQEAFGRAVEADPADVVSVNNYALCLMYQRNLLGATRYLEENLRVRLILTRRPGPVWTGWAHTGVWKRPCLHTAHMTL